MATDASTTSDEQKPETRDSGWDRVKTRLCVGQVIQGVVEDLQAYGVFFDIGEHVPAFLDIVDTSSEPLEIGEAVGLRIIQFADWNRQVRVTLADKSQRKMKED